MDNMDPVSHPIKLVKDNIEGKTVLITGHTGFKGSWLAIWLKLLGADVIGYSLEAPSEPNIFEAANLSKFIHHIHGDIRDYGSLERVFKKVKPEIVFNLAAQTLVRVSYDQPKPTYETNVLGSVNLLELVRTMPGTRVFINVTSDKCYDNQQWIWGYREKDRLGGKDPYSSSKACAELITHAYTQSFFLNEKNLGVASVRAGNVIGDV